MGDIVQILIVVGLLVFAAVRQLNRSAEEAKKKQAKANVPKRAQEAEEVEYDKTPVSSPFLSYDYDYNEPPPPPKSNRKKTSSTKKTERISAPPLIPEDADSEQEFNIHSTEEVRRGIIWSEILNRKY